MKLQEGILELQKKYPDYIILVKNGLFYNATGKDAIILSQKYKLVKICFAKDICKIGIIKNKIEDFTIQLRNDNYKYIIFDYIKGDMYDLDEQFIEKERKDTGKTLEKENVKLDCLNCEYYKRKERREKILLTENKITEIYSETKKVAKGKEELAKIFNKKKEIEQQIQNVSKKLNEYLNNLIEEYLMSDENE